MKAHVLGNSGRCMKCGEPLERDLVVLCDFCLAKRLVTRMEKGETLYWVISQNNDMLFVNAPTVSAAWN